MIKTRKTAYFPLQGGEDLTTALFSKNPGTLVNSQNFECDSGGRYRRITGYERFDGHDSPSDASYWKIDFDAGDTEVTDGDTVTGGTSGATGEALIDSVVESGSYAGGDADGYLVLTDVSGTFQNNENLQVGGVTRMVADGTALELGGGSSNYDTWIQNAEETARDKISTVTGSGDIRGVHLYDGTAYAFRDNAAGTACIMWESTASGWSQVDLGELIDFDAGTSEISEEETLTGGTSGATATVKRVIIESGSWSGNDADGYLVLSGVTGTFSDNETITTAAGSATADGANSAITLAAGGRYEFINYNFYGHSGSLKMYGCDGANYAFEYDGTTYVPVRTGMTTDTPEHITAHKYHLFLSFSGGSVQHSSTGEPLEWSPVTGAAEIGLGDECVGLKVMPEDTLAIFGRNKIAILYGTGTTDWELKTFSLDSGAIEWSIQKFADLIYFDDKGIMSLGTIDSYGDFGTSTLSDIIQPIIEAKKALFVSSMRVKNKSQYRLFFSDKTGINLTFKDNSIAGFTRLTYGHKVCCTCSGEDSSGNEMLLFGSDNGMVYELEKGTSFDGSAITAYLRTWLNALGNPERVKRFFKLMLEKDDSLADGFWGVDDWGDFEWGEQMYDFQHSYIDEADVGYEYSYYSSETYESPYTLQGVILHYSEGGLKR